MIKALIIDQATRLSDCLESFIKAKGHEVYSAKSVIEAIFILEKEKPHLVFLDLLFLGTPSGLMLIERMKKSNKKRKIYLTCGPDAMGEELAKRIGVDGAIFKPLQLAEINGLIDKTCEELG
jgi:DNA-binding response OmpR family regulator